MALPGALCPDRLRRPPALAFPYVTFDCVYVLVGHLYLTQLRVSPTGGWPGHRGDCSEGQVVLKVSSLLHNRHPQPQRQGQASVSLLALCSVAADRLAPAGCVWAPFPVPTECLPHGTGALQAPPPSSSRGVRSPGGLCRRVQVSASHPLAPAGEASAVAHPEPRAGGSAWPAAWAQTWRGRERGSGAVSTVPLSGFEVELTY